MDVASLLRRARAERDLSQAALAGRAGVRRQTVSQIESGRRSPSIGMLVGLLAAAGLQSVELEPLDEDVRRAIAERRNDDAAAAEVVSVLAGVPPLREVAHRVEGLAAAALLGAPVPVAEVTVALADTPATHRWLAGGVRDFSLRVWAPGWYSPLQVGHVEDHVDEDHVAEDHVAEDHVDAGAGFRALVAAECGDEPFRLEGWFETVVARFAPAETVARCVRVETATGPVPVQPLDEIESTDAHAARVLRVLREMRDG